MLLLGLALAGALQDDSACTSKLPNQAAISAYIAAHPSAFRNPRRYALDQITIPQSTDHAILLQLEPIRTNDEAAAILKRAGVAFKRGPAVFDTTKATEELSQKFASLPPGELFFTPVDDRFIIFQIKSFQRVPMTPAASKAAARIRLLEQSLKDCQKSLEGLFDEKSADPNQPGAKP
jgi:hypothetical protein